MPVRQLNLDFREIGAMTAAMRAAPPGGCLAVNDVVEHVRDIFCGPRREMAAS